MNVDAFLHDDDDEGGFPPLPSVKRPRDVDPFGEILADLTSKRDFARHAGKMHRSVLPELVAAVQRREGKADGWMRRYDEVVRAVKERGRHQMPSREQLDVRADLHAELLYWHKKQGHFCIWCFEYVTPANWRRHWEKHHRKARTA